MLLECTNQLTNKNKTKQKPKHLLIQEKQYPSLCQDRFYFANLFILILAYKSNLVMNFQVDTVLRQRLNMKLIKDVWR